MYLLKSTVYLMKSILFIMHNDSFIFFQIMAAGVPAAFIISHFIVTRDRTDLEQGLFGKLMQILPCPH